MIHSKKQILRSMRSYEVGGSTETCAIKPKPGCKQNKAAKKNKRQKTWRNVKEGVGKVLKIGVPAAALTTTPPTLEVSNGMMVFCNTPAPSLTST